MTDAGFFKGTTAEQDSRFANVQKKMMKSMRFADGISVKVDMSKVNLEVIKPWIAKRILDILDLDDDVVVDFTLNQLEERFPDPKLMQINLTGFLGGSSARAFMSDLWELLDSAQKTDDGVPPLLVEMKKQLLEQQGISAEVAEKAGKDSSDSPRYKIEEPVGHPIPVHRRRYNSSSGSRTRNNRRDAASPRYRRRFSPPNRHYRGDQYRSRNRRSSYRRYPSPRNSSPRSRRRYDDYNDDDYNNEGRREHRRRSATHSDREDEGKKVGEELANHLPDESEVEKPEIDEKKDSEVSEKESSVERRRKRKERKRLRKEKKRERKRAKKSKHGRRKRSGSRSSEVVVDLRDKAIKSMKRKRRSPSSSTTSGEKRNRRS